MHFNFIDILLLYYRHQEVSASGVIHTHFVAIIFLLPKKSPSRWPNDWLKYVGDDTLVRETIVIIVYTQLLINHQFKRLSATLHSTHSTYLVFYSVLWTVSFLYSKMRWEAKCEQQIKGLEWNFHGMLYVLTNMPQSHDRTQHNESTNNAWHAAPCPYIMYVNLPPNCHTEHLINPYRWCTAQWNTSKQISAMT